MSGRTNEDAPLVGTTAVPTGLSANWRLHADWLAIADRGASHRACAPTGRAYFERVSATERRRIEPCPLPCRRAAQSHVSHARTRVRGHGPARLVSARGITFAADGMIHADATELLRTKTPSHVMDAGLRDALGRSACTLKNLVSVETPPPPPPPATCDRLHLVLTGTPARSPLKCLLCDVDAVDENAHVKTCPATAQHRILRFRLFRVFRVFRVRELAGRSSSASELHR